MARPAAKDAKTIACVGGGYIGAGWAACFLAQGRDVVMSDPGPDAEAKARVVIDQAWPYLKKLGLAKGAAKKRFRFVGSVAEAVADADFVQESAPDREDLKIKLLQKWISTPGATRSWLPPPRPSCQRAFSRSANTPSASSSATPLRPPTWCLWSRSWVARRPRRRR